MENLVTVQSIILRSCRHKASPDCHMGNGEYIAVCCSCWNRAVAARRAARKAQLACRPMDCQRCGQRPTTMLYGGFKLCGRCYTATKREHGKNAAGCSMPWLITRLLVDTSGWAESKT